MYIIILFWKGGVNVGLSKEALENKKKYDIDYHKTHYKRIPLDVSQDMYDDIKKRAGVLNMSVNGYIKACIVDDIAHNNLLPVQNND